MGWARTLLLGDIGNRLDIADTERDVGEIRAELTRSRGRDESQDCTLARLQQENEQLELCLAALIKTLEARGILKYVEVANLVDMIDDD